MSSESPAVILYSSDGYELAVISGSATPANTRGIMFEGSDGTNSRFVSVDTSGRIITVGAGTAGTPTGGVLTIQGATGMTAVTVNNATASNLLANIGGLAAAGSAPSGNPVYIGGSVTTAAPAYSNNTVNALSLDTVGNLRVTGVGGTFPATQSGTWTVQPGNTPNTVPWLVVNDGYVTTAAPAYSNNTTNYMSLDTSGNLRVLANAGSGTFNVAGTGTAGTPASGVVTIQGIAGGTAIPISGTVTAITNKSTTGTITSVAASATSVTLLASNTNRVSATFYNDSTNTLYIALTSSAASNTAFSIKLLPNSYYDLPVDYSGQINGIWNGTNGACRVTELT